MESKFSSLKGQAREDITNGEHTQELDSMVTEKDRIEGEFTIIRRDKKKYFLIRY